MSKTTTQADALLVRRAQASDEAAFREIVQRYQAKVLSIVRRIVRHSNDAEDIAQQVFASVYFALPAFDHRCSFYAWLYKIAVNEAYEYLRRKKVRPLVYDCDFREPDSRPAARDTAQAPIDAGVAERDLVVRLLGHLSEDERTLLLLREVEGYSIEELASAAGLNPNTVKVRLFRARRKLVDVAARKYGIAGRAAPAFARHAAPVHA